MRTGQTLFIAGTLPFILLGALHTLYSLLDTIHPRRIVPRDAELIARMQASALRLTKETDMWRAWLGFNLSHGLGAFVFGLVYLIMAIGHFTVLQTAPLLLIIAPAVALAYLVLSIKYWFRIPILGTGLGFVLFLGGALLSW